MHTRLELPKSINGENPIVIQGNHQVTIIGANGAGKTRFMRELQKKCGDRAYTMSVLDALFPTKKVNLAPGSIDALYEEASKGLDYMRPDPINQLDKLNYLLFAEEMQSLIDSKMEARENGTEIKMRVTKLDRVVELWEKLFPGNQIMRQSGRWMFKTDAGDDMISSANLSNGEKTVLYYIAATLFAMPNAVIFIENPSLFMHPSLLNPLWTAIEELRPDCTFVYQTIDADFANTRTENICVWIKSFDVTRRAWDYEVIESSDHLSDEIFFDLVGSRRPILFIEGDAEHSIDSKLYSLVFPEYTVRPLGGCDKVIESTRTFNDLKYMHHLDSHGIVDRDRRTDREVEYLRQKSILVPEVAEVENIFLMEDVIRIMAKIKHKDPDKVVRKIKSYVIGLFSQNAQKQALQHVRHKMKRDVETKIDARFTCITALETHIKTLVYKLRPREYYDSLIQTFTTLIETEDYAGILRVFNHKPMLGDSGVAELLGFGGKDAYIRGVLNALKGNKPTSKELRAAIRCCFL